MFEEEVATKSNFNELGYILKNEDVAKAVLDNRLFSPRQHFLQYGIHEGRKQFKSSISDSLHEAGFIDAEVPIPHILADAHTNPSRLIVEKVDFPNMRILEIGSREVTGASKIKGQFKHAEYVGFDFYDGSNVDVVGDVHQLSSYFKSGEQFDFIYSSAVFEHLAMPWVVAEEISKMLKVGGHLLIETHFSFSSHERPWHFFQFSDMALRSLFSPALGFECIEATMTNPIIGRFSIHADEYLQGGIVTRLYTHSYYFGLKTHQADDFNWQKS